MHVGLVRIGELSLVDQVKGVLMHPYCHLPTSVAKFSADCGDW